MTQKKRTCLNVLRPDIGSNLLEGATDLDVVFRALPLAVLRIAAPSIAVFAAFFVLGVRAKAATTEHVPRGEREACQSQL